MCGFFFLLWPQMDPWRALFSWGCVTPSLTCSRRTPKHKTHWTWFSGCTRWRETGRHELMISPLHPDIRYCTPQKRNTHSLWFTIPINHLRCLISYGFQFPPGHICIDQLQVWGCARLHSLWHWKMALRVCMCVCRGTVVGFVHIQHFCSPRLYDTNPWVWVITSENVRAARAKGDLRYCNSDAISLHKAWLWGTIKYHSSPVFVAVESRNWLTLFYQKHI